MLIAALACAVVAYRSGVSSLLYATGFLAVLPLGALLLVRMRRRRFEVARSFNPPVVSAGSPVAVDLSVRNLSAASSGPASWSDRTPWEPISVSSPTLPALAGTAPGLSKGPAGVLLRYIVRPPARGVFPVGPLEIAYGDPFGLAAGRGALGTVQQLSVVPAIVPLGEGGPSLLAGDGNAQLIQRRSSGNDDDLMTREYRSGDAMRRVHWRASARHGELMVRQEEQRTFPEARVLIDTRAAGYGEAWADLGGIETGEGAFEWSIRMLASVAEHLHGAGFLVQILETGDPHIAPLGDPSQGSGQDAEFLLSLATLRLTQTPLPASGGIHGDEKAEGVPGPIFAVLSEPEPATLRWISAQRRPHELGVAFVVGHRSATTFDTLAAHGWICVPVRESDDPALAWASISRFTAPAVVVK
jgi:uncharacterized protein (DUF58 family)